MFSILGFVVPALSLVHKFCCFDIFLCKQAAAEAVTTPGEIDWAAYKAKLSDLDIDAVRRDYEAFVSAIPPIAYNAAADAKGVCHWRGEVVCFTSPPRALLCPPQLTPRKNRRGASSQSSAASV